MADISWRQLKDLDVSTLADDAGLYIRAIFLKKDWTRLLQLSFDPLYADELLKALRVPFVRKQLFLDTTADAILTFLDTVHDLLRKQILLILVENFSKFPVAVEVGQALLATSAVRPWAQTFLPYVLSLQSDDFFRAFLRGEAPNVPGSLGLARLLPLAHLNDRRSIGALAVERYAECLTANLPGVAAQAFSVLAEFRPLWVSNTAAVGLLKDAVRAYAPEVTAYAVASGLPGPAFADNVGFPVGTLYKWKLLDDDFVLHSYFLDRFVTEKDLPLEKQQFTLALARIVFL
jgi:hypothetical protein